MSLFLFERSYQACLAGLSLPKRMVITVSQEKTTVKNLYSPSDLPRLVPRPPCASYRMSCHTASGGQGRGCAELNRSKAIQKRCASCGSKGTFDFRLSFFPGKFPMRILRGTTPQKDWRSGMLEYCNSAEPNCQLVLPTATPPNLAPFRHSIIPIF